MLMIRGGYGHRFTQRPADADDAWSLPAQVYGRIMLLMCGLCGRTFTQRQADADDAWSLQVQVYKEAS